MTSEVQAKITALEDKIEKLEKQAKLLNELNLKIFKDYQHVSIINKALEKAIKLSDEQE